MQMTIYFLINNYFSIMDNLHQEHQLLNTAQCYSELLIWFNEHLHLISEKRFFENAVDRYEHYWLPLLSKSEGLLFPPWDVYYIWHLHMMLPKTYMDYCEHNFGKLLGHTILGPEINHNNLSKLTKGIWQKQFPSEPYKLQSNRQQINPPNFTLTRDLIECNSKTAGFHHQLTAAHYQDPTFLKLALKRYCNFMYLIKENDGEYITTTDIQLIWRAHMLNPSSYAKYSKAVFGRVRQSECCFRNSIYDNRLRETIEIWNRNHEQSYVTQGTVFKDLNWYTQFHVFPSYEIDRYKKTCELLIKSFYVRFEKKKKHNVVLAFQLISKSDQIEHIHSHTTNNNKIKKVSSSGSEIHRILFDPEIHNCVAVSVIDKTNTSTEFMGKIFPSVMEKKYYVNLGARKNCPILKVKGRLSIPSETSSMFKVERKGCFKVGPIPPDLRYFINIPSWQDFEQISWLTAAHRLVLYIKIILMHSYIK